MLKRSLIAVAVVAMLASGVNAGEIKAHCWPTQFVAIEITTIPVVVDIGYYVIIKDQTKLGIKVVQMTDNLKNFCGCLNKNGITKMKVSTNFAMKLKAEVSKASGIEGTMKVSLTETGTTCTTGFGGTAEIEIGPGTDIEVPVCVKLEGNDKTLASIAGKGAPGTKNVQIGTVKITVKPSASPDCCAPDAGGTYPNGEAKGQIEAW